MFHEIPRAIADRMSTLEALDAEQRRNPVLRPERLSQIPPETGRLLALLAASAPAGLCVEIGTSAGYSTLWLALSCQVTERRILACEMLKNKAKLARHTFEVAGVTELIDLVVGDARQTVQTVDDIAFCFLDAEKEIYSDCYELVFPRMLRGGILVCDNILSHQAILEPFVDFVLADPGIDATVIPIGKGLLLGRKL